VRVRQQQHTVGVELVEGAHGFGDGTVEVRKWQHGEMPEAVRLVSDQPGLVVVQFAGEFSGRGVVAEVNARCANRQDPCLDARVVHHRDRSRRIPFRHQPAADGPRTLPSLRPPARSPRIPLRRPAGHGLRPCASPTAHHPTSRRRQRFEVAGRKQVLVNIDLAWHVADLSLFTSVQ